MNMESQKKSGSFLKKLVWAVVIVIVVAVAVAGFRYLKASEDIKDATISAKLENASDLTTQKLIYSGVLESSSGRIPIINKDKFLIEYKAAVNAGFDLSKVDVSHDDSTVTVVIPHAEIQTINIEPEDIEFHDTNFSVLRADKNATVKAIGEAKADVRKYAGKSGLTDAADKNGAQLVKGLLHDSVGDREIKVEYK